MEQGPTDSEVLDLTLKHFECISGTILQVGVLEFCRGLHIAKISVEKS